MAQALRLLYFAIAILGFYAHPIERRHGYAYVLGIELRVSARKGRVFLYLLAFCIVLYLCRQRLRHSHAHSLEHSVGKAYVLVAVL